MAISKVNRISESYNYDSFTRSESSGKSPEFKNSLRAGADAPDFELPTVDGNRLRLSALRGRKHVLLEFGSIT
jgi:peroxiredoxin